MEQVWTFATMSLEERKDWLKDHFIYEVEGMFIGLKGLTQSAFATTYKDPDAPSEIYFLLSLEVFLLHARDLIGFFYSKGSYEDDAKANHYLTNSVEWLKLLESKEHYLEDEFKQISKYLAHLTYSRMQSRRWHWFKIYKELMELTEAFLNSLAPHYRAELKELKERIPSYKLPSP